MINLVEILKDCSKGTKFYSPIFGEVEFLRIEKFNEKSPIVIKWFTGDSGYIEYLRADGTFRGLGECIIFPSKDQRDWDKWQRPFIKGDIVATRYGGNIFILNELYMSCNNHNLGTCFIGYDFCANEVFKEDNWSFDRLATESEKLKFLDVIKKNGYEWDEEKKELKKTEPKFDVSTLQHFDKVLVRITDCSWQIDFFSHYDVKNPCYKYCCLKDNWKQCVPYNDETKHLLDTTDDAPEKYINW